MCMICYDNIFIFIMKIHKYFHRLICENPSFSKQVIYVVLTNPGSLYYPSKSKQSWDIDTVKMIIGMLLFINTSKLKSSLLSCSRHLNSPSSLNTKRSTMSILHLSQEVSFVRIILDILKIHIIWNIIYQSKYDGRS